MRIRNSKIVIFSTLVLAATAIVLVVLPSKKQTENNATISIGAILPLSGKNEYYGKEIQRAIELALKEINGADGVRGQQIKVLYEDDQADPKLGIAAMQKLVEINKVPVVLGPWASSVVLATAPIAEQNRVVMLAEALASAITQSGDYIFRIQPPAVFYSEELLRQTAPKLKLTTVGVIYINNDFGIALKNTIRDVSQKLKLRFVGEETYGASDKDFKSQLVKLKEQNPDAIFLAGYQEQTLIIRQAKELGVHSHFLAGPTFENQTFINELGALAEGVVYAYHFNSQSKNEKTKNYLLRFRNTYGVESGGYAPLMYDGVHIIAGALKECSTNTECIKNYLYAVSYDGVSGTITFDENGDPHLPIVIKTVKNGKFVTYE